eukprot:scaffold2534_cov260-Pinguiococcus_pyrenoidosus.AAC.3
MPEKTKEKEDRFGGVKTPTLDVELPVEEVPPERIGMNEEEVGRSEAGSEPPCGAARMIRIVALRTPKVKMRVLVTPVEAGWLMGAALRIPLRGNETFWRLLDILDDYKELDFSRYDIIVPPKKEPVPRENWDFLLRRLGIHDKRSIRLSPKYPNLFLWHPIKVYEHYWIAKVAATVEEAGGEGIDYRELRAQCPRPRPLHSFRPKSLLRRYPDKLYMEVEAFTGKMCVIGEAEVPSNGRHTPEKKASTYKVCAECQAPRVRRPVESETGELQFHS